VTRMRGCSIQFASTLNSVSIELQAEGYIHCKLERSWKRRKNSGIVLRSHRNEHQIPDKAFS
jgi:hypothetical protein